MEIIAIYFHLRNMLQHCEKQAKIVFEQESRRCMTVPAALQANDLTFYPYLHEPGRFVWQDLTPPPLESDAWTQLKCNVM